MYAEVSAVRDSWHAFLRRQTSLRQLNFRPTQRQDQHCVFTHEQGGYNVRFFAAMSTLLTGSCGLAPGVEARMDAEAPDWRTSGKYAIVSFAPRTL